VLLKKLQSVQNSGQNWSKCKIGGNAPADASDAGDRPECFDPGSTACAVGLFGTILIFTFTTTKRGPNTQSKQNSNNTGPEGDHCCNFAKTEMLISRMMVFFQSKKILLGSVLQSREFSRVLKRSCLFFLIHRAANEAMLRASNQVYLYSYQLLQANVLADINYPCLSHFFRRGSTVSFQHLHAYKSLKGSETWNLLSYSKQSGCES
jgi:hypothetical protein